MKKILLLTSLLLLSFLAMAQNRTVSGTVLAADDNSPLIGVTITVTGTENRTGTDLDGHFTLTGVRPEDKTVTVSYVGMITQTVKISDDMVVYLESDTEFLEETIVVAFGKQTREAFTGSATVIKSDDLTKRATSDAIQALNGKVPGMSVTVANNPASESSVNIRGLGSINASTSPLIVVDGQPFNGSMRDINPSDIDNISVLKDAASNALYGARGANGVIMITTKGAKKGTTRVSFDMKFGISTDAQVDYDKIDNPGEYYEAHYLALKNYFARGEGYSDGAAHLKALSSLMAPPSSDAGGLGYIVYSVPNGEALIGYNGKLNPNATLGNIVYNNGNYYRLQPDDWREAGIRNGFRQEYNLSMSGGKDGFSIYTSLGYLDQQGITYGSDVKRYTGRLKADYQAYKWLTFGASANYSYSYYNNLYGAFSNVYSIAPIYPLYLRDANGDILMDERGKMYDYGDSTVGFYRMSLKNTNDIQSDMLDTNARSSNSFGLNGYANIDIPYGFRITINGSVYDQEYRSNSAYNPYYGYSQTSKGTVSTSHGRSMTINTQQLLTWNHKYGNHNVDVLLGHEYNIRNSTSLSGSKSNVALFDSNIELSGAVIDQSTSGSSSMYNVEGFLGRAQYDYDSRFYASASFRRDASSRFHPDHRWGNFWSLGGAWIISKEKWFPKNDNIGMLKLKASYGEQGNDGIGSLLYLDTYSIKNSNDEVSFTFRSKGNPNITWETTSAFNAGVDFDIFKGRLNGTIEYYSRKTRDMLYFKPTPSILGYTGYYDNIGDMVNNGVEVSLNAALVKTRLVSWNMDVNFSYEKNHISYLPESSKGKELDGHRGYQGSWYFYGEGLPMCTWYMPQYMGPDDQGRPTYKVVDKDGNISTTLDHQSATYVNCGSALPEFYGGFGTSLSIGSFDIGANFTFSVGGKVLDSGYQYLMGSSYGSSYGSNIHRDALKGWSETNRDAWLPRWQYNDSENNLVSDLYLTSANQFTIQNVQVGYTLPKSLVKKIKLDNVRVDFSVDGVAYWTARKGFDPRTVATASTSSASFSGEGYGAMRTYVFGVKLQF